MSILYIILIISKASFFLSILPRLLLAFQILLFSTLWPLPCGRFRNYLLRTMCSYLLGIWVQEEITPPLPLPPPAGHLGPQNRRHLRRHHLNKSPLNDENDQSESDETATEATITTKETQTDDEATAPSSSSPSSSSLSSSSFKLFVANSLTPLDGAMISLIRERLEVGNTLRLHPLLSWLFGYRSMRRRPTAGSGGVGLSGGTALCKWASERVTEGSVTHSSFLCDLKSFWKKTLGRGRQINGHLWTDKPIFWYDLI